VKHSPSPYNPERGFLESGCMPSVVMGNFRSRRSATSTSLEPPLKRRGTSVECICAHTRCILIVDQPCCYGYWSSFTAASSTTQSLRNGMPQAASMTKELTTSSDIYYRHPDLFMKQSVVDRYIDDLACTFGVSRSQLNVVGTCLRSVCARPNYDM
jgi:hypothetical protein